MAPRFRKTDLTVGAAGNCTISPANSPFLLASCTGGFNESEASAKRLSVTVRSGPKVTMGIYGDNISLTPQTVSQLLAAHHTMVGQGARLRNTQAAIGELFIERAV